MSEYSPGTDVSEQSESHHGWLERLAARFGFSNTNTREAIETVLSNDDGTLFTTAERAMLQKAMSFKALRVEDVVVPRAAIVAVEDTTMLAGLLAEFSKSGYSRLPVFRDSLDNPLGMVHVKDVLDWIFARAQLESDRSLRLDTVDTSVTVAEAGIIREVIFAPPSMSALDLLVRMQHRHIHLALIIDEHGGTDGLVSIEDLLEEVVGDIEDEHDDDTPMIIKETNSWVVDTRAGIDEVEEAIGRALFSNDETGDGVETLGGVIFKMLERVPVRGEIITHGWWEYEIIDADRRRVKKLRIRRAPSPETGSASGTTSTATQHELKQVQFNQNR
ncbi:MAG: hemolysin family protein [Alphaproteobacteria bacterium]